MARICGCRGGSNLNEHAAQRRQFTLIARLAPGATLEEANTELATIAAQTTAAHAAEFEEYQGWRLTATPWAEALMREVRPARAAADGCGRTGVADRVRKSVEPVARQILDTTT